MPALAAITPHAIIDGLLTYVCLLILLTFHEFAHAWTAWKCGDPTAKNLGRVSLNPVVHMDMVGTVLLPLLVVFLSAASSPLASFIIGWGKPVPVNPYNLRRPRADDTLIALAGPFMNLVLAVVAMVIARGFDLAGLDSMTELGIRMAVISLLLCFFNLLPIPPLDGSHVVKNVVGMRDETYLRLCQYGFIFVIVAINISYVRNALDFVTLTTLRSIGQAVGLG